jgi:hypothetical protein
LHALYGLPAVGLAASLLLPRHASHCSLDVRLVFEVFHTKEIS